MDDAFFQKPAAPSLPAAPRAGDGSAAALAALYGALVGARHAVEADHLAAVSTLAAHASSAARVVRVAVAWGELASWSSDEEALAKRRHVYSPEMIWSYLVRKITSQRGGAG